MVDVLKYEEIGGDVFDITSRLKEIDGGYFVLRERKSGRLEVHCHGQRGGTLCVVLPYKRLDNRALEYVRRTRRERAEELLNEMRRENERAGKRAVDTAVKDAQLSFERALAK